MLVLSVVLCVIISSIVANLSDDIQGMKDLKMRRKLEMKYAMKYSRTKKKKSSFPSPKDVHNAIECQQIFRLISHDMKNDLGFSQEEKLAYLLRSIEIDAKDTEAHTFLMGHYWDKQNYDKSEKYATLAIESFPKEQKGSGMSKMDYAGILVGFYQNRAMSIVANRLALTSERFSKAISDLEISSELDKIIDNHYNSAQTLERVRQDFVKWEKNGGDDPEYLEKLAKMKEEMRVENEESKKPSFMSPLQYHEWKQMQQGEKYYKKHRNHTNKSDYPSPKELRDPVECQQIYYLLLTSKCDSCEKDYEELDFTDDEKLAYLYQSLTLDEKDVVAHSYLVKHFFEKERYEKVEEYATLALTILSKSQEEIEAITSHKKKKEWMLDIAPFYHYRGKAVFESGLRTKNVEKMRLGVKDMQHAAALDSWIEHSLGSGNELKEMRKQFTDEL